MRVVVCDAGPIIHLHESDCLPLLKKTGNLFLPHRVYMEIESAINIAEWPEWLTVITLTHEEQNESLSWRTAGGIHTGEAEAVVLSRKKHADWLLTDDAATRLFVSTLGIEVHGSLGVVLWNAAKKYLTKKEAEKALYRLKQSSLWLSENIFQEALTALDDIYKSHMDASQES